MLWLLLTHLGLVPEADEDRVVRAVHTAREVRQEFRQIDVVRMERTVGVLHPRLRREDTIGDEALRQMQIGGVVEPASRIRQDNLSHTRLQQIVVRIIRLRQGHLVMRMRRVGRVGHVTEFVRPAVKNAVAIGIDTASEPVRHVVERRKRLVLSKCEQGPRTGYRPKCLFVE